MTTPAEYARVLLTARVIAPDQFASAATELLGEAVAVGGDRAFADILAELTYLAASLVVRAAEEARVDREEMLQELLVWHAAQELAQH